MGVYKVQQLTIALGGGVLSATGTLSAASGTFAIIAQHEYVGISASTFAQALCYVTISGTTVTATRNTAAGAPVPVTMRVTVLDADSSLVSSVQQGTISINSGTSNTATVSAVTIANSALGLLGFSAGNASTDFSVNHPILTLPSTTSVKATVAKLSSSVVVGYCLINFNGSALAQSTQLTSTSWTNSSSTTTATITSASTANTVLFFAGCYNGGTSTGVTDQQAVLQTAATTLTLTAGAANSDVGLVLNCGVVTFNSGVLSQNVQSGTLAMGNTSNATTFITSATRAQTTVGYLGYYNSSTTTTDLYVIAPAVYQATVTSLSAQTGGASGTSVNWLAATWTGVGTAVTADNLSLLEFRSSPKSDTSAPLTFSGQLLGDNLGLSELTMSAFKADSLTRLEVQAGQVKDDLTRLSLLAGQRADSYSLLEQTGNQRVDWVSSLETLNSLRGDRSSLNEILATANRDTPALLSWYGVLLARTELLAELNSNLRLDILLNDELTINLRKDILLSSELTGNLTTDQLGLWELAGTSTVRWDGILPLEVNGIIRGDVLLLGETTGNLTGDSLLQSSWYSGSVSRAKLVLEALVTPLGDTSAPLELAASPKGDTPAVLALLATTSPRGFAQSELRGTLQVDLLPLVEVLQQTRGEQSYLLESLWTARSDGYSPLETLAGQLGRTLSPQELLLTQLKRDALGIEFIGKIMGDQLTPIETVNSIVSLRGDALIPLEILVSVLQHPSYLAELLTTASKLELLELEWLQGGTPPTDSIRIFTALDARTFTVLSD